MSEILVYFVATPIGNLDEITFRAVEILKQVDVIYCEDTRHSITLLKRYDIVKPTVSYHKFNENHACEGVLSNILAGKKVAIISDAGMPCISDPGNVLVQRLIEEKIPFTVLSGASAFVNAFVLSGFSAPFTFVGFLPEKNSDKEKLFETLGNTVNIFYSSVHNVRKDLEYLKEKLGERDVCVCRELTKMFETVYYGKLSNVVVDTEKGEFVIVVDKNQVNSHPLNSLTVDEHIEFYVNNGLTKMEAIKEVAKDLGVTKNEIYSAVMKK